MHRGDRVFLPQMGGNCVKANCRKDPVGSANLLSVTVAQSVAGREGCPRVEKLEEGKTSTEKQVTTSQPQEGDEVAGP